MKEVPIFFTFDNNYAVPAAVSFWSLLNRADKDVFYKMYVLHSDISNENQNLIRSTIKEFQNFELKFRDIKGFLKEEWESGNFEDKETGLFTADTLARCFAARFFPEYDKIIYSDVDVVFADDISELYDINIENEYIAAVKDAFMKQDANELSHLSKEHYEMLKDTYFAGGIWVLNLKKIREDRLENRMIEIIKDDNIQKRWNDMDVMNIACENRVKFIPLNYIAYPHLAERLSGDFPSHYTRQELYDSLINPKIVHYAWKKPWNNNPRYKDIWYDIFNYLRLPKTSIFKECKDIREQKLRRYRKLFILVLIISIISAAVNIIFMILYMMR